MDIPTLLRTMETLLAEPAEQRLARRAGQQADFRYAPAPAGDHQPLPTLFEPRGTRWPRPPPTVPTASA